MDYQTMQLCHATSKYFIFFSSYSHSVRLNAPHIVTLRTICRQDFDVRSEFMLLRFCVSKWENYNMQSSTELTGILGAKSLTEHTQPNVLRLYLRAIINNIVESF
jgi:hypothetical protein